MLEDKVFEVKGMKFRPKPMKATEILALESILNFSNVSKAEYMFDAFLERIEVEISGVWTPVKQSGSDSLMPVWLNDDLHSLHQITTHFTKIVLEPIFQKSEELKSNP